MPTASNSYNFENTIVQQFIDDAFERIGILPDLITAEQIQSAQRSANLLLSEWINKGLNLWSTNIEMINMVQNKAVYELPIPTSKVLDVCRRTSTRQLNGTASSYIPPSTTPNGIAKNAFDGDPTTSCMQTLPNGAIQYDYGQNPTTPPTPIQICLSLVGVQSNEDANYKLEFETSNDGTNWNSAQALSVPYSYPPNNSPAFPKGQIIWFKLFNTTGYRYFRIVETDGSTLDIQELYFNNNLQDIILGEISRSEYLAYPQKDQTGIPTTYWFDRQINHLIHLWPVPYQYYNAVASPLNATPQNLTLLFTRVRMLEDIGSFLNLAEVPQRFYEPLVAGIAFKIAVKYAPDRIQTLKALYDEAFALAASEDSERVPLRIDGSYLREWVGIN